MTYDPEHLYELLPAVYRIRDVERAAGAAPAALEDAIVEPLRALLAVLADQARTLEESVDQLYDDQFIETCAEWVVPYIGDLIGARTLHMPPGSGLSERADVANTIAYRRRKGTAAVLEQLAHDVTGWDAHAVEFFQRLITTQYMNHIRRDNPATPDLRDWEPLERLTTPFDSLNHTLEVRRIAPRRGRFNIPNVGIFLWRLRAYPVTDVPASRVAADRFRFDPLEVDTPLYTLPQTETDIGHLAGPLNVPMPIGRRPLDAALDAYYGLGKSLTVTIDGSELPVTELRVCDLSDVAGGWAHVPRTTYAVDPVLGRLALPVAVAATNPEVRVSFHHGFSADMGGGEYSREATLDRTLEPIVVVPDDATIDSALSLDAGAIEIADNDTYAPTAPASIAVAPGEQLEVRAADGNRPLLTGDLTVSGGDEAALTLNGLVLTGALVVTGQLRQLNLRHCTVVPGLGFNPDGSPASPGEPSLIVQSSATVVTIERSILGPIRAVRDARVELSDSIVDAGDAAGVAHAAPDGIAPGAPLQAVASTVIGRVHADSLPLVSDSIVLAATGAEPWDAPVRAERRQEGCIRFSWLPVESLVPRRYNCRPAEGDDLTRMRPAFSSLRYGDAAYCQLAERCPEEISAGADDESEMGAFHHLYQHQREANLSIRLDEYLRFGLQAGIFHAS